MSKKENDKFKGYKELSFTRKKERNYAPVFEVEEFSEDQYNRFPNIPYGMEPKKLFYKKVKELYSFAILDSEDKEWFWSDNVYCWIPFLTDKEKKEAAEKIQKLVDEANKLMDEASEIANDLGVSFQIKRGMDIRGLEPYYHGNTDEEYGGWESSWC